MDTIGSPSHAVPYSRTRRILRGIERRSSMGRERIRPRVWDEAAASNDCFARTDGRSGVAEPDRIWRRAEGLRLPTTGARRLVSAGLERARTSLGSIGVRRAGAMLRAGGGRHCRIARPAIDPAILLALWTVRDVGGRGERPGAGPSVRGTPCLPVAAREAVTVELPTRWPTSGSSMAVPWTSVLSQSAGALMAERAGEAAPGGTGAACDVRASASAPTRFRRNSTRAGRDGPRRLYKLGQVELPRERELDQRQAPALATTLVARTHGERAVAVSWPRNGWRPGQAVHIKAR